MTNSAWAIVASSPILQSTAKTGATKYWQVHVVQNGVKWGTMNEWYQVSKSGKKSKVQFSEPYESTVKNEGRSNETRAKEQAEFEMGVAIRKQQDSGYHEEGKISSVVARPLPMLAKKYSDRVGKLNFPVYVQPKYDGSRLLMRGNGNNTEAWSRKGKDIIPEVIAHLQIDTSGYIFDGELLLPHGTLLQSTMSASKKYQKGISEQLRYIVYDIVDAKLGYADRYRILQALFNEKKYPVKVELAPTLLAKDSETVERIHEDNVANGHEGSIIRVVDALYEINHRSSSLLKHKNFDDNDYEIIGCKEGDGLYKGCAIFTCVTEGGKEFDCNPEGTIAQKQEMYTNRKDSIGKYLQVRYKGISKEGSPMFPVGVAIRDEVGA